MHPVAWWLIFPILLLLLNACAATKPQADTLKSYDGSNANLASIYFYISASLFYYDGDYLSARELYQRALQADAGSTQITKQILLSSAQSYLSKQTEFEQVKQELEQHQALIDSDESLLLIAYTVYQQADDQSGMSKTLNTLINRFPSSRAYLQRYLSDYKNTLSGNAKDLSKAYQLASGKPDELIDVARLYSMADIERSIEIANEAIKLDPKNANYSLLGELLLRSKDPTRAITLFRSYAYPQQRELMKQILEKANELMEFKTALQLKPEVLATQDADLMALLAYAAYVQDDYSILGEIFATLKDKKLPEPADDAQVAAFMVAAALDSTAMTAPQEYLDFMFSIQDADDVLLYRTLRRALKEHVFDNPTPEVWNNTTSELFPSGIWHDYFDASMHATSNTDSTLIAARIAICEYLVFHNRGYETDYRLLLEHYYNSGQSSKKFPLLYLALDKFPRNPLYANDLGYSLLEYPDSLETAGKLIGQAVTLEPDNAYYQDSFAWYHYLKGDYAAALEHLQIPLKLDPMPSEIAYHIGMILVANNNPTLAKDYFISASKDDSSPIYQQKALTEIKRLYP